MRLPVLFLVLAFGVASTARAQSRDSAERAAADFIDRALGGGAPGDPDDRAFDLHVEGPPGARAFVESVRSSLADCAERFVPADARGTATMRGQIDGTGYLHWIADRRWDTATLPYERFRICAHHLLLDNWSGEATQGDAVVVTLVLGAGEIVGVGGLGGVGTGPRRATPRPAYTTTTIESSSADDWETRTILTARAMDVFPRCAVDRDGRVAFQLSLGAAGEVRRVRSRPSHVSADVVTCLEALVRQIQFIVSEGRGASTLRFTLALHHHPAAPSAEALAEVSIASGAIAVDGEGTIDLPTIGRVVVGHTESLARCWESRRADGRDARGRLVLRLTVDERGHSVDVAVASTELSDGVGRCASAAIVPFVMVPSPSTRVTVLVPIDFGPAE